MKVFRSNDCATAAVRLRFGFTLFLIATSLVAAGSALAQTTIDNGILGDGQWQVSVRNTGDSSDLRFDPDGPLPLTGMLGYIYTYIDVGADGGATYLSDTAQGSEVLEPDSNCARSVGQFAGSNGAIDWTARGCLPFGSKRYTVTLTFESPQPFGALHLIWYVNSAILGTDTNDWLGVFGTPGGADFRLLSIDEVEPVGFKIGASFTNSVNAAYIGWAASEQADLINRILSASPLLFNLNGNVNTAELPKLNDPRYPGVRMYGERNTDDSDPASAFAFNLTPTATTATVSFFVDYATWSVIFADGFDPG